MKKLAKIKIIAFLITLLTSAIMICLIQLLTQSYIVASILYLIGLLLLLRLIGSFLLFPGNFFYVRSSMEIRFSRQLSARIVSCFRVLHSLRENIMENKYCRDDNFNVSVDRCISSIIKMMEMFEQTLSKRKIKLLEHLRNLKKVLLQKDEGKPCLLQLISKRRRVKIIKIQEKPYYQNKFNQISVIVKSIDQIIKTYVPPKNIILYFIFLIFNENLFQIRFGLNNWSAMYNYQISKIQTSSKNIIQTGIIHNLLVNNEPSQKKAILLCNPNGVFIQFFGDHYYVLNYLKLGYHVILWNYRGYGQSTGSSTIIKSQEDAYAVYRFYREKGYTVDIVHGYSVGGTAAVGLIQRIDKNKSKYPEDQVRLLVNDRSFSSIAQVFAKHMKVPIQFGWFARNITRLIFYDQNIDNSALFEQAKCKKIILWDSIDQIISARSSLKYRIIKRMKKQKKASKKDSKDQLHQQSTIFYSNLNQVDSICKKFYTNILKIILNLKRKSEQKQITTISQQVSSASTSTADQLDENRFEQLMNSINLVDGGGIRLFQDYDLWSIQQNNPKQLKYLCQSYVLGLICYGSSYPLLPIMHSHEQIKTSTLKKINLLLQKLTAKYRIRDSQVEYSQEQSGLQIHKNLFVLYSKLVNIINMHYGQEWFNHYGCLLPIRNGHNNSLSMTQMEIFNNFIRKSIQTKQQQVQLQK